MKYILDYGHGGNDPGAIGIDGVKEKDIVLEIGKRVKYHLERHKQTVIESRSGDTTVTLTERSNKANNNNVDLCISIHCNAFTQATAQGVEIFYKQGLSRGEQLGKSILNEITKAKLYTKNRGLKTNDLHMTREPKMAAVLIELGFITNATDKKLIVENKENFAVAITKGILNYYELPYTEEKTQQNATTDKIYRVQVGAYKNKCNAEKMVKELKAKGYNAIITNTDNLYRVQVGAYKNKSNAQKIVNELKSKGYSAIIK